MEISEDAILGALISEGGQVKNSELLSRFKEPLNCSDPGKKKQNRELFKTFVNNVAVVKEIGESKYIVLKKKFHHLLPQNVSESAQKRESEEEKVGLHPTAEEKKQDIPSEGEEAKKPGPDKPDEPVEPDTEHGSQNTDQTLLPIELALQKLKSVDVKTKRSLQFVVPLKSSSDDPQQHVRMGSTPGPVASTKAKTSAQKPCALPLRIPQVVITHTPEARAPSDTHSSEVNTPDITLSPEMKAPKEQLAHSRSMLEAPGSPRYKRRSSTGSMSSTSSPQLRRHCKSMRPVDEPRDSEAFPLDPTEHEWLVSAAVGHWGLVYGHLLNGTLLAEKRDFLSGFTALHWAAKCGHREMVCKIIDLSREKGKGVDINAKSFSGYTPLHVAALHDQHYVLRLLVQSYGADRNVRDNCGKKAHHYLRQGVPTELRELLGAPRAKAQTPPEPQKATEEPELHRHAHTISRLFQPNTVVHKRKPKGRASFQSVVEEPTGDRGERAATMPRVRSDVFS